MNDKESLRFFQVIYMYNTRNFDTLIYPNTFHYFYTHHLFSTIWFMLSYYIECLSIKEKSTFFK